MEMSESHETLSLFEAELMSSVPVSRANRQVWQESGKAQAMLAGSGRQLSMLLDQSTPLGAFSKILLESSAFGNSKQYSYVWKRLDTKFGCSAFQLTPLAQITLDTGYSLWRTPQATDPDRGSGSVEGILKQNKNGHSMDLGQQVKLRQLWPPPTVPNGGRRNPPGTSITGQKPDGGKAQIDLREYAIRMLPTPKANDAEKRGDFNPFDPRTGLAGIFRQEDRSGSLNPQFVCQLMGYPENWTEIK